MQNSPHEVFQCVVLGYNRLKKNRVTRGLPTSFHSIESKGDSDKFSNMVTLNQVGYNIKKYHLYKECINILYKQLVN